MAVLLAVVLLLGACAPVTTEVVVRTDPPGGQVSVGDQQVKDGNMVELLPGSWDFVSSLDGYRDGHVYAEITTQPKSSEPESVMVPLGVPFGLLTVLVSPADAGISIDSDTPRRGPELHAELDPGPHDITITHPDYPRVTRHVDIVTGREATVQVEMADTAPLTVVTTDDQAVVFVDGARAGQGARQTVGVSSGAHAVRVIHTLNGWQRRFAKRKVVIEHESGLEIELAPKAEQWLFEGQWLAADEARDRESHRFGGQAVADPAVTNVVLGKQAAEELRKSGVLPRVLHHAMRVGDRVVLNGDGRKWEFTKRNGTMGAGFKAMGEAFGRAEALAMPWDVSEPLYELNAQINENPLVALATAVVRTRLALPLVDLAGDELMADGLTVNRNTADGPLMVVASAGEDIEVDGRHVSNSGKEKALRLDAGDSPVLIGWSTPPAEIAVIATRKLNQLDWRSWKSLLRGDKRLGAAFAAGQVKQVVRVSKGPEYPETATELFEANGPLAKEMNLHMIDLGPHDVAGDYFRSWRFVLDADGVTQRQLDLHYKVSKQSLDTDTRNFLRHEPESKE